MCVFNVHGHGSELLRNFPFRKSRRKLYTVTNTARLQLFGTRLVNGTWFRNVPTSMLTRCRRTTATKIAKFTRIAFWPTEIWITHYTDGHILWISIVTFVRGNDKRQNYTLVIICYNKVSPFIKDIIFSYVFDVCLISVGVLSRSRKVFSCYLV